MLESRVQGICREVVHVRPKLLKYSQTDGVAVGGLLVGRDVGTDVDSGELLATDNDYQ